MVDSSFTNSQAVKSRASQHPRHVHAALHGQLLPGAKAMFHLQSNICRSCFPHMLQWVRQLYPVEQHV